VTKELTDVLIYICDNKMDARANSQISSLVHDLAIMSLEMASQRAHVLIEQCSYGDRIQPGTRFKDDSSAEGSLPQICVDLMTQPCMVRVGDGSADLGSEKVLVKGDVVALRG
jgi:hypothetical protein